MKFAEFKAYIGNNGIPKPVPAPDINVGRIIQVGVGIYFYQEANENRAPLVETFGDLQEFADDELDD